MADEGSSTTPQSSSEPNTSTSLGEQASRSSLLPGYVFKPPEPVKLAKNGVENWKIWKQLWQHYCVVSNVEQHPAAFRKSLLISTMGVEALQIYNGCDPLDTDTAEDILNKLDAHILGETNETFERYKFNTRIQKSDETIDDYLASLKTLAKTGNLCECLKTSLLRDRIVLGVRDDVTRKRLLQEGKLTLRKALDICRTHEKTTSQLKVIAGKEDEVHRVNISKYNRKYSAAARNAKGYQAARKTNEVSSKLTHKGKINKCKFCGAEHIMKKEACKAWGKQCNKCKGLNHFARCCSALKPTHVVRDDSSSDSSTEWVFPVIAESVNSVSTAAVYAEMSLEDGGKVKFQVDCGATVNVIPKKYVHEDIQLEKSQTVLNMYNKSTLKPVGRCRIITKNPTTGKKYNVMFEVVKQDLTPLLSRRAAEQMKLITINYGNFKQVHGVADGVSTLVSEYKSVFDNNTVGNFSGKVSLRIDGNAKPVQCPPRRVPIAVKSAVEQELYNLVHLGVIKPVTEPTEWCSQISVQKKKDGKLRVCIDPKVLNEALQRERYPLPTIDDVLPELAKATFLSKVDLAHGYWHCELDEKSSYLTTFITPFRRFRWCRLPFGLKVSAEIFQRKLNECLNNLPGTVCVADDILVFGCSEEDHDISFETSLMCVRRKASSSTTRNVFSRQVKLISLVT
ncbi:uncharacterized protein K02A2.6-like [Dendronephthya gigantea]|uniref:uncharacterized protein K02A2.6-like n=1 Tax=Dendronephthya gigantea TaxID=151771 RepID=UPI00106C9578|nr:uncharacterized protein K02A2.6-like [Dendronephthya gigantea]